jgi:hypothetical protein
MVNQHRDVFDAVPKFLEDMETCNPSALEGLDAAIKQRMIDTDTIVEVQFYPDTPVGFYRVLHHDLNAALAEAVKLIEQDQAS